MRLTDVGVFTQLSRVEAQDIATAYGLGSLGDVRGIPAGSVNSGLPRFLPLR